VYLQVEKSFREGTARQNVHSVFVSLALKLLEERVHVACKEIIHWKNRYAICALIFDIENKRSNIKWHCLAFVYRC
jgi:hypothetical protein